MSIDGPKKRVHKIGLVLTGGGAKGAYQAGCLNALHKAGYTRLSAISGTSVGAMNGILLAAGRLDAIDEAWSNLRLRDIIGLKPRKILLLPLWAFAAIFSEFCLAKVLGIPGSLLMALHRSLAGSVSSIEKEFPVLKWVGLVFLGALTVLDDWTRRIFLGWIFTSNEPLASRLRSLLSEDDLRAVSRLNIPVYATLSRYRPGAGWFPQYIRLDKLTREQVVDTLVQSAGFPGIFPAPGYFGRHVVDGGWTDNIPAAPLIFDQPGRADVLIVIKVDRTTCRAGRFQRFTAAAGRLLWGRVSARPENQHDDLMEWSRIRWEASLAQRPARSTATPSVSVTAPRVLTVVPPQSLGSMLTGTLWFSRAKIRKLIAQGEADMRAVLEELAQPLPSDAPSGVRLSGTGVACPASVVV